MCTQSCPTLCDTMDCSPAGSSVHGVSQARILEWVAISSSRGSSRSRDQTCIWFIVFFFNSFIFNWRIIALQYWFGFCHTSTWISHRCTYVRGFPDGASGKEPTCQCGRRERWGFDPGLGRSPGEGNGNPLQYSCLENPMDRGAWQATVHGVAKSCTRLKRLSPHIYMYICYLLQSPSLSSLSQTANFHWLPIWRGLLW